MATTRSWTHTRVFSLSNHMRPTFRRPPMPRNVYRISSHYLRVWPRAVLFILLGSITHSSFAQTTADGTIHGRVADSTGAAVSNANITARSPNVGGTFSAISDAEGNY